MSSDKPTGAGNQQGSRRGSPENALLTPQRLHAELLAVGAKGLEAYLQGALRDGTRSRLHDTHRIGQSDPTWLDLLVAALDVLGHRAWVYREGRDRDFWVMETSARFLALDFDAFPLVAQSEGLCYARGYFDSEGGMPRDPHVRLYFQFTQKDKRNLEAVRSILESWGVACGRIHNPSHAVDPRYWRFYVRAGSHERFMRLVGSWHPRKRRQIDTRMKI
ncbi:MAG: LAGLIDADG family homing endonuclease [Acidimicrobiia bacterium]